MKVIGLDTGIGFMLHAAERAGLDVAGAIESNRNIPEGLIKANFPNAFFERHFSKVGGKDLKDVDLLLANPNITKLVKEKAVEEFTELSANTLSTTNHVVEHINYIQPTYFLMEVPINLIKEKHLAWWTERLPLYRLAVELVSHYGYGNVQVNRNRAFFIGKRKGLPYCFAPGEKPNTLTLKDVIGDLHDVADGSVQGHYYFPLDKVVHDIGDVTAGEIKAIAEKYRCGMNLRYYRGPKDEHGRRSYIFLTPEESKVRGKKNYVQRPEAKKGWWDRPSYTLTENNRLLHPLRCTPLTSRERMRIMGASDSFVLNFSKKDTFFTRTMSTVTGLASAVQFVEYFCKQLKDFTEGKDVQMSGGRSISLEAAEDYTKYICSMQGLANCAFCICNTSCTVK